MGIAERREREREARRAALREAARELLIERGFAGTTTKAIAERCELSEATLFFYFGSKEEILVSLLFEGIDYWARGLERLEKQDLAPAEKLARVWKFFGEVRREHPEYFLLSAYLAQPTATANVAEEVRAEIVRRSGENFSILAQLLLGATGTGNARIAADLVWSAFFGVMALRDARANLGAKPHPTERELGAALQLLLEGLAQSKGDGP
jgi:AcrR family transcriptional regulator